VVVPRIGSSQSRADNLGLLGVLIGLPFVFYVEIPVYAAVTRSELGQIERSMLNTIDEERHRALHGERRRATHDGSRRAPARAPSTGRGHQQRPTHV
jgi:hypothetical protein